MKRISIIHLLFVAIAILAANCSQDDALIDSQADDNLQSYTLYLDADAPSFETVREGETRASGNSWEDGDVIYVVFSNGGSEVVSNATYKSNLGAFQFSSTSLSSITDASCRVYYFRGGSFSESNGTVKMDKYTAIFTDTDANYSCSNYTITLFAALKPYTWRLCFKGSVGRMVQLNSSSSILYNSSLNLTLGSFSIKTEDASLQVQNGGYTQYIYGMFSDTSNSVQIDVGVTSYSRTIASSKLSVGESGYYFIPTSSNLYGWTKDKDYSGTIYGHTYVDLGLPSGTLWATYNIGASKPVEYGGYFAWGETAQKDYYGWDNYIHCDGTQNSCHNIGDNITGTEYDVAHLWWGGPWKMPSLDQIKELRKYCSRESSNLNGVKGILVRGRNGAAIFLPAAGYRSEDVLHFENSHGSYWSSSPNTTGSAYRIYFDYDNWFCDDTYSYYGLPVRAVSTEKPNKPYPVAEAIDLDLPSGTKWASWNVGASSPEEYGGYYAWGETEEKSYYDRSTYKYYDGSSSPNIGDDISGTEYDVAHVKWGDSWQMPSLDQIKELVYYCTFTWTQQDNVNGALVTGPNGASIFLPAAGRRIEGKFEFKGENVDIWSSLLYSAGSAYYLLINSGNRIWKERERYYGHPIRPVCNEPIK